MGSENLKKGGVVLATETDKAFQLISKESDWAFYIQADEVIHEKYHDAIRRTAEFYKDDRRVEGLLFNYLHFYGTTITLLTAENGIIRKFASSGMIKGFRLTGMHRDLERELRK